MTDKEKIELQREAFIKGVRTTFTGSDNSDRFGYNDDNRMKELAKKVFPMPKKLRELTVGRLRYRFDPEINLLEFSSGEDFWQKSTNSINNLESPVDFANLILNPYESEDAD